MGASDYYWSRNLIRGFGKMWFLLSLQEASSPGGGRGLLGSVVQENSDGILWWADHYPVPFQLTTPQLILKSLQKQSSSLGISDGVTLSTDLSAPAQSLKVSKKHSLKAGTGPFPSLPVHLGLDIDYARMKHVDVSFGSKTTVEYIPTGYLKRLYDSVDGDASKLDPNVAIDIDDNYIVDQVLLANEFSVTFESEADFSASFDAKLSAINSLPDVGGKVSLSKETNKRVVAKIQSSAYYLIALKVLDWDDLG